MMKRFKKYTVLLTMLAVTFVSCDSLLDVDSERNLFPDEHQVDSVNDTIYSMVGILSKLQPVATQYVLLGELRGDLMQITNNARLSLQQLNNFAVDSTNEFVDKREYYEVIKHCNYLIHNIDTSVVLGTDKVLYKEFAAAKAIRAWTYMQLAINFKTVAYIEEPFISIADAQQEFPEYTMSELAPVLINDLEPWKDIDEPGAISLGSEISSANAFFPIKFVLGDLYLWSNDYENAAKAYYDLIESNYYRLLTSYKSRWVQDDDGLWYRSLQWSNIFETNSYENITQIASSMEFGDGSILDTLSINTYEITPSEVALSNWEDEMYYHTANIIREGGDLRGESSSYMQLTSSLIGEMNIIWKYLSMSDNESKAYPVYRISMLYSRYAEAVNRLGKPNLAFAVIKNGLSSSTIMNDSIVPANERLVDPTDSTSALLPYVDFEHSLFDGNIGMHEHGSGNVDLVAGYRIPRLATLSDSVTYVEDVILHENALEFAFEGNRFQDLMRVALRRNDPAYLADKVAAKFGVDQQASIQTYLNNTDNWYLK